MQEVHRSLSHNSITGMLFGSPAGWEPTPGRRPGQPKPGPQEREERGHRAQVPGLGDWCGNFVKTPSAATALDQLQDNDLRLINKADCRPSWL
jgi:hypothetical protein